MLTPLDEERPEGEEIEPEVFESECFEADTPLSCEECHVWLDNCLTADGVDYLKDEANEFPEEVIRLYLGSED